MAQTLHVLLCAAEFIISSHDLSLSTLIMVSEYQYLGMPGTASWLIEGSMTVGLS